jgi:hypothetical protein
LPRRPPGYLIHRLTRKTENFRFRSLIDGLWLRACGNLAEEVTVRRARRKRVGFPPPLLLLMAEWKETFVKEADRANELICRFGEDVLYHVLKKTPRGRRLTTLLGSKAEALLREERDRRARAEAEAKAPARAAKFTPLPP